MFLSLKAHASHPQLSQVSFHLRGCRRLWLQHEILRVLVQSHSQAGVGRAQRRRCGRAVQIKNVVAAVGHAHQSDGRAAFGRALHAVGRDTDAGAAAIVRVFRRRAGTGGQVAPAVGPRHKAVAVPVVRARL